MKYTITQKDLDRLTERLADLLNEDIQDRVDYSGRGMYGETCVGWTHAAGGAAFGAALVAAVVGLYQDFGEQEDDNHLFNLGDPDDLSGLVYFAISSRGDSMGWDSITYFPDLTFERGPWPEITTATIRANADVGALMRSTEHAARTDEERIAILVGQVAENIGFPIPASPETASESDTTYMDKLHEESRLVLESEGWVS